MYSNTTTGTEATFVYVGWANDTTQTSTEIITPRVFVYRLVQAHYDDPPQQLVKALKPQQMLLRFLAEILVPVPVSTKITIPPARDLRLLRMRSRPTRRRLTSWPGKSKVADDDDQFCL